LDLPGAEPDQQRQHHQRAEPRHQQAPQHRAITRRR
jgi:hypothetical protein